MNYEKAYKEALNWMRSIYPTLTGSDKEDAEHYFPELKESEDERVRRWIYSLVENLGYPADEDVEKELEEMQPLALAYLNKQKERGPLTKEEEYILHRIIEYLEDETCPSEWISLLHDIYCLPYEKQKEQTTNEEMLRTLRVEYEKGVADTIAKYEQKEQKPVVTHGETYHVDTLGTQQVIAGKMPRKPADDKAFEEWIDDWWKHNKVNNPDSYDNGDEIQFDERGFKNFCRGIRNMYAEQKPNIELIQKSWYMEGYHDREYNKEPKWIIKTGEGGPKYEENPKYGQIIEQKPEQYDIDVLEKHITKDSVSELAHTVIVRNGWEIVEKEQKPAEWSEYDESYLQTVINEMEANKKEAREYEHKKYDTIISWLKSLRPQPKRDGLDDYMKGYSKGYADAEKEYNERTSYHIDVPNNWPPKMPDLPTQTTTNDIQSNAIPHWKPSEEQMEALKKVTGNAVDADEYYPALATLYYDLKEQF